MPLRLSIVIPAWNEAGRLPASLNALRRFCTELELPFEVLIVVEPSQDDTLDLAQAFAKDHPGFEVIANREHRGKGHAVRTGMLRARGELVFYMDADLSVPLPEVRQFLAAFASDPEVAVLVGNRAHRQSRISRRQSWLRQKLGQTFNKILQGLALVSLRDTQCGFKAFRQAAAEAIFSRQHLDGFAFDVEVLLLAQGLGLKVGDLPVEWINSPESKVDILRDGWRMFWDTLWLRGQVRQTLAKERSGKA